MNYTITEELQDRLNHWSKELDLTSILAVQNTGCDSFDVTINTGNELENAFVSIVAALYASCVAEHRENFAESIFGLVDIGLDKGRKLVEEHEG